MNATAFPAHVMHRFVEILSSELGHDVFFAVLGKAGLPAEWSSAAYFSELDAAHTAEAYSKLQAAMRVYYGRGARGILMRIGAKLWSRLLEDAPFGVKTQAALIRTLPTGMRRKSALDLLARFLSTAQDDITVHTLDLDLLFVDHTSPTVLHPSDPAPICFVTFGLIRECLFWASGIEHDIEETACRAQGANECEFKITTGGTK